jgi:aromatic ring-opening dioxygenase LigB subunit
MVRLARRALVVTLIGQYCHTHVATARLIASAILPHGDFAWDPALAEHVATTDRAAAAREAAAEIAHAARTTGRWLGSSSSGSSGSTGSNVNPILVRRGRRGAAVVHSDIAGIDPDLVFLSTPHGVVLSHDFGIYLNAHGSGSAEIGLDLHSNDTSPYTVTLSPLTLAPNMALDLLDHLHRAFFMPNVTGVQTPSDQNLLAWAEVIPLLLIPRRHDLSRHRVPPLRQHLIWSHPQRRHDVAALANLIPELLRLGQVVGDWLDALPASVAVVISGDLSHVHQDSGPYGGAPAIAQQMDAALGQWASNPCHETSSLLKTAAALQPTALSCGFTGFVLLHGMLCGGSDTITTGSWQRKAAPTRDWTSRVLVNRNVTYYGMMVAQFTRDSSDSAIVQ